jgi:hypothetical protein
LALTGTRGTARRGALSELRSVVGEVAVALGCEVEAAGSAPRCRCVLSRNPPIAAIGISTPSRTVRIDRILDRTGDEATNRDARPVTRT